MKRIQPLMPFIRAVLVVLTLTACGENADQPQEGALFEFQDGEAERGFVPKYADLATGRLADRAAEVGALHPWPFAVLSIGHTSASYQNYGGDPYFHHGLDIRGDAGTTVSASAGGKVVNIENYVPGVSAYWEIAILDDQGFIWQYHHVDRDSIPQGIFDAFKNGGRVAQGTKLGEIFYWSVTTFGERYHHVHLNILGAGGKYFNPFSFLERLPDTKNPDILSIGLLKGGRSVSGTTVSGTYSIYAQIHDLILHQKFVVPANEVTYSLDGGAPVSVWDFNRGLPGESSTTDFVHGYFVKSLTCGDYSCRKLVVDLGFTKDGETAFTTVAGPHTLRVTAKDFSGNTTSKEFAWNVE